MLRDGITRPFGRVTGPAGLTNEAARDAWLQRNLEAIPAGSVLLDAGAGTQRCRRYCAHLKYVSQDFCRYDGQGDNCGLQNGVFEYGPIDIVSDITSIPRLDGSFDAIMAIEVLEHLPDPLSALREFSRLLRHGGDLLLTAPFCSLTHQAPFHFTSGFNAYWYSLHLDNLGFRVVDLERNGNFFEFLGQELRRVGYVSRRYTNMRPTCCDRLAIAAVLHMMARMSRQDTGSAELLCYGYHVHAVRI